MELNLYSSDGKLNLFMPDGQQRFYSIHDFIKYYSDKEYNSRSKDACSIVDDLANKLLNADAFDEENGREEVFFLLAWKIGGINYTETYEHSADQQNNPLEIIRYKSNWIWDKQNPSAKSYGHIIAPLIGQNGLLDKVVELSKEKTYWKDKAFAEDNTRAKAAEILEILAKLNTRRIGSVYLLTLLYFLTNGRWPIYDQFAYLAMMAIQNGGIPNIHGYKYYPDHMPSKQKGNFLSEMKNLVYGKDPYGQYYSYVEFVKEFQKAYLEEGNKLQNTEKTKDYKTYIESRDIDRALWAYGHYFKEKTIKKECKVIKT